MTKRLRLEIPIVLPEVPDERDECVTRLEAMLGRKGGLVDVHIVADEEPAELCIHYDPEELSLGRVRKLAEAAGAKLTERYGHFLAEVAETTRPRRARAKADRLLEVDGVLEAGVSGAGAIRVEYDREVISADKLREVIRDAGLRVRHEFGEEEPEEPRPKSKEKEEEHDHDHGD